MKNTFKVNLKRLREINNISQVKLARDLNFTKSTICDWEHGLYEPDFTTLVCLAKYFNVAIAELIEY